MYNDRYTAPDLIRLFHESVKEMLDEVDRMADNKSKSGDNSERTLSAYTQKIMGKWFDRHGGMPL